jgi:hypothetical protein
MIHFSNMGMCDSMTLRTIIRWLIRLIYFEFIHIRDDLIVGLSIMVENMFKVVNITVMQDYISSVVY